MNNWTKKSVIAVARKYTTLADFLREQNAAYHYAYNHGFLDKLKWLERKRPYRQSEEVCRKTARKCKTFMEFREKYLSIYTSAYRNGWLKDYTWLKHGRAVNGTWDAKSCYREARKYRSLKEFMRSSNVAYDKARKQGWITSYTWLTRLKNIAPTYRECREVAVRYTLLKDFRLDNPRMYKFAAKNGWLKKFKWLRRLR